MIRLYRISGIVQGVGFRPYVWHLARELGLTGWVRNDAAGVEVLVQGRAEPIAAFTRRLPLEIPPLARVDEVRWQDQSVACDYADFSIIESGAGEAATMIGVDTAVCADCLAEMFDPGDRRYRHAFINCTHCGPRYTLTRRLPYDRKETSMAAFPLCPDCGREYRDPGNRRFHAEPTACPVCGPRLFFSPLPPGEGPGVREERSHLDHGCSLSPGPIFDDVASPEGGGEIATSIALLQAGHIVAIKGLGGFHLACDARNAVAVAALRARKNREEKPFAVMAANPASLAETTAMSPEDIALLQSRERPIVLLRKKPEADAAFPGIAPGLAWLGAMLPYTPIHWLLFHEAAGRPHGTAWMAEKQGLILVMTSANPGGEPLVIGNDEARTRLAGIADAILLHDRDIVVRCDDSVVRSEPRAVAANSPAGPPALHLRRARGYTPAAIRLPHAGPPVLALGGLLKNTLCVTRGDEAFLSQHIGGLDNPATCEMLIEVADHLLGILRVRPRAVAHDLHPDFFSTRHAQALAAAWGVPAIAVQHHHAHIAAVAAEHGVTGPLLGLALDGVGLGLDGRAWGGELLRVEGADFQRIGHLDPLPLPGGDRAAQEPWRMAAAVLHRLGRGEEIAARFATQGAARHLPQIMATSPTTSSLGRVFDAAAGLLGLRAVMAYEGQAAMLLEGLAEAAGPVAAWPEGYVLHGDGRLDLLPLLSRLADQLDAAQGAALFHSTLAAALVAWVETNAANAGDLRQVALGGGCFLNHLLSRDVRAGLVARGYTVLEARQAPPNDGGLSLGQAWVARQKLA